MAKALTAMEKLKKAANNATEYRQHDMLPFSGTDPEKQSSSCRNCGMEVTVNTKPAPNDIDIGGQAVALNCPITPMLGMATWCIKIVPSQKQPYFVYLDSTDEKAALDAALSLDQVGGPDTFGQSGVWFTNHILHELAKAIYLKQQGGL